MGGVMPALGKALGASTRRRTERGLDMKERHKRTTIETTNSPSIEKQSFASLRRMKYRRLGWNSALLAGALMLIGCGVKPIVDNPPPPDPNPNPNPVASRDVVFDSSRALDGTDALLPNSDNGN